VFFCLLALRSFPLQQLSIFIGCPLFFAALTHAILLAFLLVILLPAFFKKEKKLFPG
jgi:hypothetical protein